MSVIKFPKIVCLCGSTKFKEEFELANKEETLKGYIVLTVGFFAHCDPEPPTKEQKSKLDALHKNKILLSEEILVINPGDYIGESTKSEIDFAIKHGKKVRYWNKEV